MKKICRPSKGCDSKQIQREISDLMDQSTLGRNSKNLPLWDLIELIQLPIILEVGEQSIPI